MYAKKRHTEKILMKKTIAQHNERTNRHKADDDVPKGAVPHYLLDREQARAPQQPPLCAPPPRSPPLPRACAPARTPAARHANPRRPTRPAAPPPEPRPSHDAAAAPSTTLVGPQVDSGLKDDLVFGDPNAPRFVWWEGRLRPVPAGPLDLPVFDLMSLLGKIRAGLAVFGFKPAAPDYEESVEQFVRRNLARRRRRARARVGRHARI